MKKITLNETDLMKIVKRVLNEQKIRQFDEDEIDLLHLIFERELKPPFREGDGLGAFLLYHNLDGEPIGYLVSYKDFELIGSFKNNIKDKICQVFEFSRETADWWNAIEPHLKSWLEDQLNIELHDIE